MTFETIAFEAGELTFDEWLEAVDREVLRITTDYDRSHFRDFAYADSWELGIEPVRVAREMLADDAWGREFLALAEADRGESATIAGRL